MMFISNMKSKNLSIIWALIFPLFTNSCLNSEYITQHFSFPPGSKPHENNWEYIMTIIVSSDKSPISIRSEKRIKIKIQNKSNTLLLNEDFDFTVATVRANVAWDKFETIRVELFEQGNEFAKDPYNTELLKSGPNTLLKLTYHYDQKAQKFKRVN